MSIRVWAITVVLALCVEPSPAQNNPHAAAIDTYLRPYVRSGNFSGSVLVEKNGKIVFEKAYGFADRERGRKNSANTRFHIASMSMQFTAATVLRLVDAGSLKLDDHVGDFAPRISGSEKITIRDLLTERSGLPDINSLAGYEDLLQHHQTPASLVARIEGQPLLFEPGSKFLHEEHSAYNLLALVVEKKANLPFAAALEHLVFGPMGMASSGVDDDIADSSHNARGYEPVGTLGLKPATAIHWSAKTGNASVYTTARDEARWVRLLFGGHGLSAASREAILDTSMKVGYGWFKRENKRFGEIAYSMNGRAPGFASFVLYLPHAKTTVVVLSNVYSSSTTTIGNDVAAISLDLPFEAFRLRNPAPGPAELITCAGKFQFGSDFYQPNAEVELIATGRQLSLHWPSGEISPLIPIDRDHFMDRSYWTDVKMERDASGRATGLAYDDFRGRLSSPQ